MPFYGESYPVEQVTPVAGTAPDYDALYYHFDADAQTFTAGDAFLVSAFADAVDYDALVDQPDVTVSWVIETGPTTAGTITVASGLDPDWDGGDPSLTTEDLGAQTVTGTATLVYGPAAGITHADLIAYAAEPLALIEVTAGTVEVLQVKLRVWPTAGPGGAWTVHPGYTTTRTGQFLGQVVGVNGAVLGDGQFATKQDAIDDALARAQADLAAQVGSGPISWNATGEGGSLVSATATSHSLAGVIQYWTAAAQLIMSVAFLSARDYPLPSPTLPSGYDPREIRDEDQASVRSLDGGDPTPGTFGAWTGTATGFDQTGTSQPPELGELVINDLDGPPDLTQVAPFSSTWQGLWTYLSAASGDAATIPHDGSVTVSLAGRSPYLSLCAAGPALLTGTLTPDESPLVAGRGVALGDVDTGYTVTVGDFLYWDPTLPWVPERPAPRFFVRDLDMVDRPVGFGKPPEETATFLVPTPMGFYRDLTTAEYDALLTGP